MTNRQDVEKFLICKYGADVFKYKGFIYVRDMIADNEDYIIGNTIQEYNIIAAEHDETYQTIERAIRYFKDMLDKNKRSNTVFINNLIFEFKEWKKKNEINKFI